MLRDPLLRSVAVLVAATNAFDTAYSVVLPLFARDHLPRASDFGWVTACFGGGAATSALLFEAVGHRLDRRLLFATAFLLVGAPASSCWRARPGWRCCW